MNDPILAELLNELKIAVFEYTQGEPLLLLSKNRPGFPISCRIYPLLQIQFQYRVI